MNFPNYNSPTSPVIHEAAIRIARQCRNIIQSCLRENEWAEADREFYKVARQELEALKLKERTKSEP